MQSRNNSQTIDIDLLPYLSALLRGSWLILLVAVLAAAVAGYATTLMTPKYQAFASVLIESKPTKVLPIEEVYTQDTSNRDYVETQLQIMNSRQVKEKVIESLNLTAHPLFNSPEVSETGTRSIPSATDKGTDSDHRKRAAIVKYLTQGLTISLVRNTQVATIEFVSKDPQLAAEIANAVAKAYIRIHFATKRSTTDQATDWLNESLVNLKNKLDDSRQKLADFYESQKLVNVNGIEGLAETEVSRLNDELVGIRNQVQQNAGLVARVEPIRQDPKALLQLSYFSTHPTIQALNDEEVIAEANLAELSKYYTSNYYKVVEARTELETLRKRLFSRARALASEILSEQETAEAQMTTLQESIRTAEDEYRSLSLLDEQRVELERDIEVNQEIYDSFLSRLKEASQLTHLETSNARILDQAQTPLDPVSPRSKLIVAGAFLLGGAAVGLVIILLTAGNTRIRSEKDIQTHLKQRLLGAVPSFNSLPGVERSPRAYFNPGAHLLVEALGFVANRIRRELKQSGGKVVLVSSSIPGEGKSTSSCQIAFALAECQRVLVVELDLRKPGLAKTFNLPTNGRGVIQLVNGSQPVRHCIYMNDSSRVDLMVAGGSTDSPQKILSSKGLTELIAWARDNYDYIVLDTPPVLAVSDALMLGEKADLRIHVVRHNSTQRKVAKAGLERFSEFGLDIDGVLLNAFDARKARSTGDTLGYYGQYSYSALDPKNIPTLHARKPARYGSPLASR